MHCRRAVSAARAKPNLAEMTRKMCAVACGVV